VGLIFVRAVEVSIFRATEILCVTRATEIDTVPYVSLCLSRCRTSCKLLTLQELLQQEEAVRCPLSLSIASPSAMAGHFVLLSFYSLRKKTDVRQIQIGGLGGGRIGEEIVGVEHWIG
jgi:hypothetical protein